MSGAVWPKIAEVASTVQQHWVIWASSAQFAQAKCMPVGHISDIAAKLSQRLPFA